MSDHCNFSDPSRGAVANITLNFLNEAAGSILGTTGYRPEESLSVTVFIKNSATSFEQGACLNLAVNDGINLYDSLEELATFLNAHYDVADSNTEILLLSIYNTQTSVDELDKDKAIKNMPYILLRYLSLAAYGTITDIGKLHQHCGVWFVMTPGIKNGNPFTTVSMDRFVQSLGLCPIDDTFTHIDTAQMMSEMIFRGVDPSLTRDEQLATLLPVNPHYHKHTQAYIDTVATTARFSRVPQEVLNGYVKHSAYRYEDVAIALNQLLDTVSVTSWDDLCHDDTVIEQAAWFFSTKTTRDMVIYHTDTRTDDVKKLCRLAIASFHDSDTIMCNTVSVYAFCLVLAELPNAASLIVKHTLSTHAVDMPHELLTYIHQALSRDMTHVFPHIVTQLRDEATRDTGEFDEIMHYVVTE